MQLNDADDRVLVIAHRHDQHRFRPVPVLLVEGRVEAVLGRLGDLVGVVEAHDLAAERDVSGDRAARERQHRAEMGPGILGSGLRDGEAQLPFGPSSPFSSKNRLPPSARVSSRALRTISLVQFRDVAFGRERDADREQTVGFLGHRFVDVAQVRGFAAILEQAPRGRPSSRRRRRHRAAARASPRRARFRRATSSSCRPASATTIVVAPFLGFDQLRA